MVLMSTQAVMPPLIREFFRQTFDPHFPYDNYYHQNKVVLESSEGIRFHFPLQTLIDYSNVFADASTVTDPNRATHRPVPLTFASTAGLRFYLRMLERVRRSDDGVEVLHHELAFTDTVIAAIRIAHVLDSPTFARALLRRPGLDVYLKYVIEQAFALPPQTRERTKISRSGSRNMADVSFSLDPVRMYRRSLDGYKTSSRPPSSI
jgi:hypothetical protein